MNFEAFRVFREDLLLKRNPLRLDCMNPERAMSGWERRLGSREPVLQSFPIDAAVAAWRKATGWLPEQRQVVVGRGIRELLVGVFSSLRSRIDELWLPGDVYPVYGDLAREQGYKPRSFPTLPEPDWVFLDRLPKKAAVLLPIPLSPRGRPLRAVELERLIGVLERSPGRLLIVDAAYTYDFAGSRPSLEALFNTDRAILLWSCSKPWLMSKSLGLAAVPEHLAPTLRDRVEAPPASTEATAKLEQLPDLPRLQQEAFRREWARLEPRLRKILPTWSPPELGYFSVVPLPFKTLLEEFDILGVPGSVFGSTVELTIITCLHDLSEHEQGPQST